MELSKLNKNNKIALIVVIVVVSFILGDIWGSHRLPFQNSALQSSAAVAAVADDGCGWWADRGSDGACHNNYKRICNSGWWWYYSQCYGGAY